MQFAVVALAVPLAPTYVEAAPPDGTILGRAAVAFPATKEMAHFRAEDPPYAKAVETLRIEAITLSATG
jgi:hypothetical protein